MVIKMNIFSAVDIVKKYDKHTALDGVSINVRKNSIFGLLGPNGAGKTSLIRIINQITGPDSGELYFNGERLQQKHIEQIGYLPEERGLYKKMQVGEQALYLAQLKGLSRHDALKKLKYWFEKFEITTWWNKKIEELSKGMQQKVQFIVTVLHEPELLILDEPFSGFDPINANLIKNEILELKQKGISIIFSTHNMASVEELCDDIALINRSKKILDGSVHEIKKQYKSNTYKVEFTGNLIAFTNAIWTGCELIEKHTEGDHHVATVKLLYEATPNQLLQAIIPHVNVNGLHEIIPGMNDIFIAKVSDEKIVSGSNYTE
jgi:ABC-2 type transport system ATP-binding protein